MEKQHLNLINRIKSIAYKYAPIYQIEVVHRVFNPSSVFKFKHDGERIKFYLPNKNDFIQTNIIIRRMFYESWALYKLRDLVPRGLTYIDIGGNIGNHTVYFGKILGAKHIYTFEPQAEVIKILQKNVELNNLSDSVTVFNCGIGSQDTKAEIGFNGNSVKNIGCTTLKEVESGTIEIRKLDSIVFQRKIDFIKIDVEGMEFEVLNGAEQIIRKDKPILWVEILDENRKCVDKLLRKYDYRFFTELSEQNYIYKHL